ncbi:MAG: hypothetical protein WAN22_23260 [Solirubrobacteraceae bacterium]
MNCTSAALSRGFTTTVPDNEADDATAPSDCAPVGIRGVGYRTRTARLPEARLQRHGAYITG